MLIKYGNSTLSKVLVNDKQVPNTWNDVENLVNKYDRSFQQHAIVKCAIVDDVVEFSPRLSSGDIVEFIYEIL